MASQSRLKLTDVCIIKSPLDDLKQMMGNITETISIYEVFKTIGLEFTWGNKCLRVISEVKINGPPTEPRSH